MFRYSAEPRNAPIFYPHVFTTSSSIGFKIHIIMILTANIMKCVDYEKRLHIVSIDVQWYISLSETFRKDVIGNNDVLEWTSYPEDTYVWFAGQLSKPVSSETIY